MRRLAAVLGIVVVLAVPMRARGDGEAGKARAKIIAGSIMTAMGLTVGAGHFLVGLPLLIIGVQRFNALPRQPTTPAAASPLLY